MGTTPTSKKPEAMNFYEALRNIVKGGYATRLEWGDKNTYIFIADELLKLRKVDGSVHNLITHILDIEATDWVILNPVKRELN